MRAWLALAACVALGACTTTGRTVAPTAVGAGVVFPTSTVTDAPAAPSATTGATTTAVPAPRAATRPPVTARPFCEGPARPGPANVETRVDPSGWRLTLTVGDRLCFATSDDISFELDVQNTTTHDLQYDSNQTHFFSAVPTPGASQPGWQDSDCRKPEGDIGQYRGGPLTVAPGQTDKLLGRYPATDPGQAGEACRHLRGAYDIYGILRWCPPGSTPQGSCDPSLTKDLLSAPVRIGIG